MKKIIGLFLGLFLTFGDQAFAVVPPPPTGWTHEAASNGTAIKRHGLVGPGGPVVYSSPVAAEIDGNPHNGLEVAVASADGTVQVFLADGTLLWSARTPNSNCGSNNDRIFSSPAVGALRGGSQYNVVLGYGGFAGPPCDGGVIAYRGTDGSVVWNFSLKNFAKKNKFGTRHHGVYSTPALADVDRNGRLEIGFGSLDRNVYLLDYNGRVRWFYNAADTVFSSPTFVNIDRDKNLEMIIGTDISRNGNLRPPTKDGGFVYAFKTASRPAGKKRVYFNQKGSYVWRRYFDQVMQSAPTVADVLPGNRGSELIIGSGCFFPQNSDNKKGKWIKILRLKDGRVLQTLNAPGCMASSPAVGDIDEDGQLEVVATVNADTSAQGSNQSYITAWKPLVAFPLWSTTPRIQGRNDTYGGQLQSPVIADIDGNGSLEVLAANVTGISVLNGRNGAPITCQTGSCDSSLLQMRAGSTLKSTPVIADINRDGVPEVIIGSEVNNRAGIFAWHLPNSPVSSPGLHQRFSAPWPMFRGNSRRTGVMQ